MTFISAEVTYSDGSVAPIDPFEIMEPFRFSTARPSWDRTFGPKRAREPDEEVVEWLSDRVRVISNRSDAVRVSMCWTSTTIDITDASAIESEPCEWTVIEL